MTTYYVNNSVAHTSGDGTTNGTGNGGTNSYNSLQDFVTARAGTLSAPMTVYCSGGAEAIPSYPGIDFSAFVTDGTNFLTIECTDTQSASTFASGYRLIGDTDTFATLTGIPAYTVLRKIRHSIANNSGTPASISLKASATGVVLDRCWLKKVSTGGVWFGVEVAASNQGVTVTNTIIQYDAGAPASYCQGLRLFYGSSNYLRAYNCTITGFIGTSVNDAAVYREGGAEMTLKNCAIFNNYYDIGTGGNPDSATYCASDDTISGTGNVNISPGGTESTDWAAAFTDYAAGNFTVKNASSCLYNAGTDLSGSGVTVDHIGTSRPQSGTFDIGAFELIAGGNTLPLMSHHYQMLRNA